MIGLTDEEKVKAIERLKILTGNNDEKLIGVLIDEAEAFVLGYTNRTRLVTGLEKAVRDLAVIALNRLGTEGETGRTAVAVDKAVSALGLKRIGCADVPDPSGMKHKQMRYEGIIDMDSDQVYWLN